MGKKGAPPSVAAVSNASKHAQTDRDSLFSSLCSCATRQRRRDANLPPTPRFLNFVTSVFLFLFLSFYLVSFGCWFLS